MAKLNSGAALAIAAVAGALLAGCSADFPPFSRLTSLRVLAIQSEPAAPAPGETAVWSALVYVPPTETDLQHSWEWCPFQGQSGDGYPCRVGDVDLTDETLALLLEDTARRLNLPPPPPAPPLMLGAAPTADLLNGIDPAILAAVCAGVPGAPVAPNCADGFPIQIKLTITSDKDKVVAVATGRWRFPDPVTQMLQAPNANPTVEGLTAQIAGASTPITEPAVGTVPRDEATTIDMMATLAASETYAGLDDDGRPAELKERLFATWFVETGGTDDSRTSFFPGSTPFEGLVTNTWTPARVKDYAASTARLIVVLHDNRGGVGWASGSVQLEPTP